MHTKQQIQADIAKFQQEECEDEARMDEIQTLLTKVQQRRDAEPSTKEEEDIHNAHGEIRRLEIAIEVLRQSVALQTKLEDGKTAKSNDRLQTLQRKCERKRGRIEETRVEATKYRVLYDEIIAKDERTTLRHELNQLQHQVYLKERQAHVLQNVQLDTDVQVTKLKAAFNDKLRLDTTDTDRILDPSSTNQHS